MSIASDFDQTAFRAPRLATESVRDALLWIMAFASGFVFIEPGPYEVIGPLAMFLFGVTGLAMRPLLAPLTLLLVSINIGYAAAFVQVSEEPKVTMWVLTSAFLASTAIFYAAMLGSNLEMRLKWLLRGYQAAALIASAMAIAAYFGLFGGLSEIFLLYGRARGTFNDPNVLGAFLILPSLLALQGVLLGRPAAVIGHGLKLLVIAVAILLTFSRAAWGMFALCSLLLVIMTFATTSSRGTRLRITVLVILGLVAMTALLAFLLSFGNVADMFSDRASLEQSYDVGHFGRFGRYILGAEIALEHPLGLGPLKFGQIFLEDPHNTFLNAFMSGGWLAGVCYATLCAVTLVKGFRFNFAPTPWRGTFQVIYVGYLGIVVESAIIDIDHWRHYFLILGVLWGLMAASQAYLRDPSPARRMAAVA